MSRTSRLHPPRDMRGVGLIEVLVAILVMGIGMLGIAALQATTLRNSQGALERSQAVIQSYGMLDAMRANRAVALNGGYNLATMTCAAPDVPNALAKSDLGNWINTLKAQTGGSGCGQIACVATAANPATDRCTITVQWATARGGAATQSIITRARL